MKSQTYFDDPWVKDDTLLGILPSQDPIKDRILGYTQERDHPEIQEFRETMNHFFHGEIEKTQTGKIIFKETALLYMTQKTQQELRTIINTHINDPQDLELQINLYTQKTKQELETLLGNFGLTLLQKYNIEEIEGTQDNPQSYYTYPLFGIKDIDALITLLQKIQVPAHMLKYHIKGIIYGIRRKIRADQYHEDSKERQQITQKIKSLSREIERLGLWKSDQDFVLRRDLFVALEEGCIQEYQESQELGFECNISKNPRQKIGEDDIIYPPIFFDEFMDHSDKNNADIVVELVEELDEYINESYTFIKGVKHKKRLCRTLSQELMIGILIVIDNLRTLHVLADKQRNILIENLYHYVAKIEDLNEGETVL